MSGVTGASSGSNYVDSAKEIKKTEKAEAKEAVKSAEQETHQAQTQSSGKGDTLGEISKGSKKIDPAIFDGAIFKDGGISGAHTTCWGPEDGGKLPPAPTRIPPDIIDIISKIKNPTSSVEDIRHASGDKKEDLLLGFKDKLDNMSKSELKQVRDYLVDQMASPTNKDDKLLGKLLNMVNHELDTRKSNTLDPFPPMEMTTKALGEEGGTHKPFVLYDNVIDKFDNIKNLDKKGKDSVDIKSNPFEKNVIDIN